MKVEESPRTNWARKLRPGQRAELWIVETQTGQTRLILTSTDRLFEAPNWHPDGKTLVVNADGLLFRVDLDKPALREVPATGLPELNNDHLIAPDGKFYLLSANDGHIYRLPLAGGTAVRLTRPKDKARKFRHWLHGVTADGNTLSYVGTEVANGDEWAMRALWQVNLETGEDLRIGPGYSPADGPEYAPDGKSIYFNSEFRSTRPGHAQIFRHDLASGQVTQITDDDRVNWFAHPAPDGSTLVYLSYPPGTEGHPADCEVILRLIEGSEGKPRDLVTLFGGQGTINVPSWAPDSRHLAYVAYPVEC
jgi:TolB protein